MGGCPCPRCLIPLDRVQNLGMALDMMQRKTLSRKDDEAKRHKVQVAREIIYNENYAVDSQKVETLLKQQSLTPTAVCIDMKYTAKRTETNTVTECLLSAVSSTGLRHFFDSYS